MNSILLKSDKPVILLLKCILLSFFIGLTSGAGCDVKIDQNDKCYIPNMDKIQVAFILDRTKSYENFSKTFQDNILSNLTSQINSEFPKSEFALSYFGDYSQKQGPANLKRLDPRMDLPDDKTGCYLSGEPFTTDLGKIKTRWSSTKYLTSGGNAESSLTAILFTAVDKTLKWNAPTCNLFEEKQTHRVMILLTEETSTKALSDDANRTDPKGDGTDTCESTKIPTPAFIKEKLKEKDIYLIPVVNVVPTRPKVVEGWQNYLNDFGLGHTNPVERGAGNEKDAITITKIMSMIKVALGNECEMGDPPAYNTLGL